MIIKNVDTGLLYEINPTKQAGEWQSTCPICSATRKKKRDRCFSFNLDERVGRCHHCQASFVEFKDGLKNRLKKDFYIPKWENKTELTDKAVKWFEGRMISQATLRDMKIYSDKVWMPQFNKEVEVMCYPYFVDGNLINVKYRGPQKSFKLVKDAELVFYNLDCLNSNPKELIICEGECFTGEAEVLTSNGFIRFDEYAGQDVAQIDDNKTISFIRPNAIIKKNYDGKLIEFKSRLYYSLTTPGHNMVFETHNHVIFKKTAEQLFSQRVVNWNIPSVIQSTESKELEISDNLLRFYVAISADFTLRDSGDIYAGIKKERKKERFENICKSLNIPITVNKDNRGYYSIFIRRGDNPLGCFKLFPMEWISKLSQRQCRLIIDESKYWDGNSVPNRNQIEYSSKEYHNALFFQTISHIAGYSSSIIKRKNKFGEWFKVSILFNKQYYNTQSLQKREINYNGNVYCVSVPTGMIVVRQKGIISITGNCDALSFYDAGFKNVVSVPNGATATDMPYLDNYIDRLENIEIFYIAADFDDAGLKLRNELVRRLGSDKCRVVTFEGRKDANELYCSEGGIALRRIIQNAAEVPINGMINLDAKYDDIVSMFHNGLPQGSRIGVDEIDEYIRWQTSRLAIWTGIPSHGKSEFVDFITTKLCMLYGWKILYFSPENFPLEFHFAKLASKITGREFRDTKLSQEQMDNVYDYIHNNFFWIEPYTEATIDSILERTESYIKRHGIKQLVIDPYNCLEHQISRGESETVYIGRFLDKLSRFCKKYDILIHLVAHPAKMIKDAAGKYPPPTLYDISGSANFYNKADYGLSIHRNFETSRTNIHVLKVKFKNLGNVSNGGIELQYNVYNGRYAKAVESMFDLDCANWLEDSNVQTFIGNNYHEDETPF